VTRPLGPVRSETAYPLSRRYCGAGAKRLRLQ